MMKRKFSLLVSIFLLLVNIDCFAFSQTYSYNYEVNDFSIDDNTNIHIAGWAIINAGVDDESEGTYASPDVHDYLGSTESNKYKYTLYIDPIEYTAQGANGRITYKSVLDAPIAVETKDAISPNLTEVLCYKPEDDDDCSDSRSAPYDYTGFSFDFNLKDKLKGVSGSNGILFILGIKSTTTECQNNAHSWCNQQIRLAIPVDAIDENDAVTLGKIETSTQLSTVDVIGNYIWRRESSYPYIRLSAGSFQFCTGWWLKGSCGSGIAYDGAELVSVESGTPSKYNIKVYNPSEATFGYSNYQKTTPAGSYLIEDLSAAFVAPKQGSFTIINEDPFDPIEFDNCTNSDIVKSPQIKDADVCVDNVSFSKDSVASCVTVESTNYYKIDCKESVDVAFSGPIYTGTLKPGLGFGYNIDATSSLTCEGTFDYELWKKAYVDQHTNWQNFEPDSAEAYEYKGNIKRLNEIYRNYINFDGIRYAFNPLGTMNFSYSVNGIQKTDTVNFIDVSPDVDISNEYDGVTPPVITDGSDTDDVSDDYDNSGNLMIPIEPSEIEYDYSVDKKLSLPVLYYNYKADMVVNVPGTNNISLGNKYFLDESIDPGTYKVEVDVENLGFSGTWTARNRVCSLPVNDSKHIYRTYDEVDPFLTSSNPSRGVGENWSSSKYDFTAIAKENTAGSLAEAMYTFELTSGDIAEIKKENTQNYNVYIGAGCNYNKTTTNYSCPIINNYNK